MNRNTRRFATIVASILFLTNAACTTIKPVYDTEQTSFASQIKAGDRVRLAYLDGRVVEIRVTEVSASGIKGGLHKGSRVQPKGAEIVADWQDIYSIEDVKISALKTAGAAVGVVVAIPFLALCALFAGACS